MSTHLLQRPPLCRLRHLNRVSQRLRLRRLVGRALLALMILLLASPRALYACGPFSLDAIFTFTLHPDFPLERYARGDLGVLQPMYARSYLYVAYRQMSGVDFNAEERNALGELWKSRLDYSWHPPEVDAVELWREERKRVVVGDAPGIEVYRSREKPNEYEAYLNCQQDAFKSAAATLATLGKRYGVAHPSVKAWVEAQDMVFANCSEGERVPAPADVGEDAFMRANRAYQIAAAKFYAAQHDEARKAFEEIARDASSPWRQVAAYMVARTLVRQSSLGEEAQREPPLVAAEKQLQAILADASLQSTHADARRLLGLVRVRLRPAEKLHELAHDILRRDAQQTLKQDVWDYTLLLDKLYDEESLINRKLGELPRAGSGDDLTDWLVTFQVADDAASAHALERWEKTSSLPWLVAALSKLDGAHPKAAQLIEAAARVPNTSPAFSSVAFHSVRLLTESGREDEARARLDAILAGKRDSIPASALNLLLGERMTLARNLEEFLQFAQRTPSALSWDEDGRELPAELESVEPEFKAYAMKNPLFDVDGARALNEHFPLALLRQAATSRALTPELRREVALAAWVRSVLLEDREAGRELAPLVASLAPELKGFLDDEAGARTAEARKFSALYALLKFPGLRPYLAAGIGRTTPLKNIDSYRDNWWCARTAEAAQGDSAKQTADAQGGEDASEQKKPKPPTRAPLFLDARQKAVAARENARLAALGSAPNLLTRLAVEWAGKAPDDPRVPEALHLAVRSTRYGCTDEQTAALSKSAFQILHSRYPKSEWAKKTPYWFKNP